MLLKLFMRLDVYPGKIKKNECKRSTKDIIGWYLIFYLQPISYRV